MFEDIFTHTESGKHYITVWNVPDNMPDEAWDDLDEMVYLNYAEGREFEEMIWDGRNVIYIYLDIHSAHIEN